MGLPAEKLDGKYSFADYRSWPVDERWEIIDGIPYNMSPAPSPDHQRILAQLSKFFFNYFDNKPCEALFAPFDVYFPDISELDENIYTVVQPDLVVICDSSKIDHKGCKGAPDLVIEITFPSTFTRDLKYKFDLYEREGVKEYWIVHTTGSVIEIFTLGENKQFGRPDIYTGEDVIKDKLFAGLEVDLKVVFPKKEENTEEAKKRKGPPVK